MKRKYRLFSILLVLAMICSVLQTGNMKKVNADEVDVSIAVSSSSISIGDTVTVTVMVSGSSLAAYTLYVNYDSGILSYQGGSGYVGGGSGTLTVSGEGGGSCSITFQAIANGIAGISTGGSEFFDMNLNELSVSHAGVSVTVETPDTEATTKAEEKTTTENKDDKTTTEEPSQSNENSETEDTSKSKNTNLASLEVSPGELYPSFTPDNIYYSVDLSEEDSRIVISAVPEDAKASTYVSGDDSLKKGVNSVRITVTAENGAVKVYYLTVNCGTVESTKTVQLKDVLYTILESDFPDAPNGFSQGSAKYNGIDIPAYENQSKQAKIVALSDPDENVSWFVYDEETQSFTKYYEYSPFARYLMLPLPKNVEIPEGYEKTEADLGNGKVTVYENKKNPGFYLVYAVNVDGNAGLYLYDQVERSFMRYQVADGLVKNEAVEQEEVTEVITTESSPAEILGQEQKKDEGIFSRKNLIAMLIGALALFLIMAVVAISFIIKNVSLMHKLDEAEEENEEEHEEPDEIQGKKAALRRAVTDDTIGIQLEDVIDNNSAVHIDVDETPTVEQAMASRPYGIDSAFSVEPEKNQEEKTPEDETTAEAAKEEPAEETAETAAEDTPDDSEIDSQEEEAATEQIIEEKRSVVVEKEPEKVALPKAFLDDDDD